MKYMKYHITKLSHSHESTDYIIIIYPITRYMNAFPFGLLILSQPTFRPIIEPTRFVHIMPYFKPPSLNKLFRYFYQRDCLAFPSR